jgi:integrase
MRREELCGLRVKDLHSRQGVMHFRVKGKRSKIRFIPVNAAAQRMIEDYLALTGHRSAAESALFRPVANNRTGRLDRHLDPNSVYQNIVRKYGRETGLSAEVMGDDFGIAINAKDKLSQIVGGRSKNHRRSSKIRRPRSCCQESRHHENFECVLASNQFVFLYFGLREVLDRRWDVRFYA